MTEQETGQTPIYDQLKHELEEAQAVVEPPRWPEEPESSESAPDNGATDA